MAKRMNKKGDAPNTGGMIILIVLLAGGAIMAMVFYTDVFGRLSGAVKLAPSEISLMENLCSGYVSLNNRAGYCNDFKELAKNQWMNCDYVKKKYDVSFTAFPDIENQNYPCDNNNAIKNKCNELKISISDDKKFKEQIVNGFPCINTVAG